MTDKEDDSPRINRDREHPFKYLINHFSIERKMHLIFKANVKKTLKLENTFFSAQKFLSTRVKTLRIQKFEISQKCLQKLLCLGGNIEKLYFLAYRLDSFGIVLSQCMKPNLLEIMFENCGGKSCSDWEENPDRLKFLIKAILQSPLRDSLSDLILGV